MGRLDPYIELLAAFVEQGMDAKTFEARYLQLFKQDETMFPDEEFLVLDALFGDVDMFEADPELRDSEHLDEPALRASAARSLARLRELASEG
jgi:hypothetical protein